MGRPKREQAKVCDCSVEVMKRGKRVIGRRRRRGDTEDDGRQRSVEGEEVSDMMMMRDRDMRKRRKRVIGSRRSRGTMEEGKWEK